METNASATEDLAQQLNVRTENTKRFYREDEKMAEDNQRANFRIVENGTNHIIVWLFDQVGRFAEAGRAAGAAWAAAFNEAASMASLPDFGGVFMGFSEGAHSRGMAFSEPVEIHLHQTINSPVASPSQINRETERLLNNMLNYR